jgi:hypothetical protein
MRFALPTSMTVRIMGFLRTLSAPTLGAVAESF